MHREGARKDIRWKVLRMTCSLADPARKAWKNDLAEEKLRKMDHLAETLLCLTSLNFNEIRFGSATGSIIRPTILKGKLH